MDQMEQSGPNVQNMNEWEEGGQKWTEVDLIRTNRQIRTKVDIWTEQEQIGTQLTKQNQGQLNRIKVDRMDGIEPRWIE